MDLINEYEQKKSNRTFRFVIKQNFNELPSSKNLINTSLLVTGTDNLVFLSRLATETTRCTEIKFV